MTPEQKAKELVQQFRRAMTGPGIESNDKNAKYCAIICVSAIIDADPYYFYPNRKVTRVEDHSTKEYWKQVRESINNLP